MSSMRATPILNQLKAVDEELSAAKDKLRVARSELSLVLSDEDMAKLTKRITTDFENFPNLDFAGQKALVNKYVTDIGVEWIREPMKCTPREHARILAQGGNPDFTGIVFLFMFKVGTSVLQENNGSTNATSSCSGGWGRRHATQNH